MRMWMIHPSLLCRQHLLGEHRELHTLQSSILLNKSVLGYMVDGLIELHNLNHRHEEIVREMIERGYQHNSELPYMLIAGGRVNRERSMSDLIERCPECRARIETTEDFLTLRRAAESH